MQVVTKTHKTFDLLGITEEQYALIQPILNGKARTYTRRAGQSDTITTRRPYTRRTTAGAARAAKRATKIGKRAGAKTTNRQSTIACPIGGEPINKRGVWQHIKKHGRETGLTEEQSRAEYDKLAAAG